MASWLASAQADSPSSGRGLIHDALATVIPAPVLHVAALFSNLVYRLLVGQDNDPTSLRSTLLPPLITLALIYVSLVTAYRMLRSTIALAFFALKWGAILALVVGVWAYWAGEGGAALSEGTPRNRPMWQRALLPDVETLINAGLGMAAHSSRSGRTRRGGRSRGFGDAGADEAQDLAERVAQGLVDEILPPRDLDGDDEDEGWPGLDTLEALLPSVGLRLRSVRAIQAAAQALMANLQPPIEGFEEEPHTRPRRKQASSKSAAGKKKKSGGTKAAGAKRQGARQRTRN